MILNNNWKMQPAKRAGPLKSTILQKERQKLWLKVRFYVSGHICTKVRDLMLEKACSLRIVSLW